MPAPKPIAEFQHTDSDGDLIDVLVYPDGVAVVQTRHAADYGVSVALPAEVVRELVAALTASPDR